MQAGDKGKEKASEEENEKEKEKANEQHLPGPMQPLHYVSRRCATCHLPAVGGHRELATGKFKKVGHVYYCTGPCSRTLAECGYESGHKEERRQQITQRKKEQDEKKKEKEEQKKLEKEKKKETAEERKRKRDEADLERARKLVRKRKHQPIQNRALEQFLIEKGVDVAREPGSPAVLQKALAAATEFSKRNPTNYEPGKTPDPALPPEVDVELQTLMDEYGAGPSIPRVAKPTIITTKSTRM